MKRPLLFATAILLLSFVSPTDTISKKEKKSATTLLKDTEKGVFASVKGLSAAQLSYKPAADKWSVEDCLKHIAVTEKALWELTEKQIKAAANPEARSEIKASDDQVVHMIESRAQKVKTFKPFEPENTPYKSAEEALASFKENREKLIKYVNETTEDLRNHVIDFPAGKFDSYQMILFIAAHSNRHTQQIEEVKASEGFPKN